MRQQREECYFEPRVIDNTGAFYWYGEKYHAPELLKTVGQTVYIRDNGMYLYVYNLYRDDFVTEELKSVKAEFKLTVKIKKYSNTGVYGKIVGR